MYCVSERNAISVVSTPISSAPNTTLPTNSPYAARKAGSSRADTRPTPPARRPALWTACRQGKSPRVRPSTVPVGPAAVHSSRHASRPPSTGEGMASSAFDPREVDAELALTSDTPKPMLKLLTPFGTFDLDGLGIGFCGPVNAQRHSSRSSRWHRLCGLPHRSSRLGWCGINDQRKDGLPIITVFSSPALLWRSNCSSLDSPLLALVASSTDSISWSSLGSCLPCLHKTKARGGIFAPVTSRGSIIVPEENITRTESRRRFGEGPA